MDIDLNRFPIFNPAHIMSSYFNADGDIIIDTEAVQKREIRSMRYTINVPRGKMVLSDPAGRFQSQEYVKIDTFPWAFRLPHSCWMLHKNAWEKKERNHHNL
jgi:hypothetical protein